MEGTVVEAFRTSVGGFHRGDVMNYISKSAEKYNSEIQEIDSELQKVKAENEKLRVMADENERLRTQISDLESRLAEMTEKIQNEGRKEAMNIEAQNISSLELAAYRRAESVERLAQERAKRVLAELNRIGTKTTDSCSKAENSINEILLEIGKQFQSLLTVEEELLRDIGSGKKNVANVCGLADSGEK